MNGKKTVTYPTQYGHHTVPVEISRDKEDLQNRELAKAEREVKQCERDTHIALSEMRRRRGKEE